MTGEGNVKRRAPQLGRGLSALFGDSDEAMVLSDGADSRLVPIEQVFPNPKQPRRRFTDVELNELARSIRERGIVQPLLVRPRPGDLDGTYEIVAGERRWRAAQQVALHEVPVIVRDLDDAAALQVSIIENVQRQDLSCLEEATAYRRLLDEFGHTQEAVAGIVGKSRSHIANSLRLLNLPAAVQRLLEDDKLSAGHARALLGHDDPAKAAEDVVRQGLSVRQTEALVQRRRQVTPDSGMSSRANAERAGDTQDAVMGQPPASPAETAAAHHHVDPFDYPLQPGGIDGPRRRPLADQDADALARDLGEQLGMRVRIAVRSSGRGSLTLDYQSLEQLDYLLARLSSDSGPYS